MATGGGSHEARHQPWCSKPELPPGAQSCPTCGLFQPGNTTAWRHGQFSERSTTEVGAYDPTGWTEEYRKLLHRHILDQSKAISERPGRLRSTQYTARLMDMIKQAAELDAALARAASARADQYDALTTDDLEAKLRDELGDVAADLVTDAQIVDRVVGQPALERRVLDVLCADPARRAALVSRLLGGDARGGGEPS